MSYGYVKTVVPPTSSHLYPNHQHQQDKSRSSSSASSSSSSRRPPEINMSYHHGSSNHQHHSSHRHHPSHPHQHSLPHSHQQHPHLPFSLTPAVPVAGPPSASPFSPSSHTARPARNVTEIIPRLYISDLAFAENPASLSTYRITHILSSMSENIFKPPPSLLPNQPVRLQVRVEDLPFAELAGHLPSTTAFIREALAAGPDTRVLVHCAEGISRSVSVVAAFLMAQYNWSPTEALHYIKGKRTLANPNFGFVQQLHEYARDSLGRPIANPVPPFSTPR